MSSNNNNNNRIDRSLPVGIRCTVQLDPKDYGRPGNRISGRVVSPSAPREDNGTYWGYTVRLAQSLQKVFDECPFENENEDEDEESGGYGYGYDLKIGTSERGDVSVEDKKFVLPQFRHALIVFGGVAGIEECVDADDTKKRTTYQTILYFLENCLTCGTFYLLLLCFASYLGYLRNILMTMMVIGKAHRLVCCWLFNKNYNKSLSSLHQGQCLSLSRQSYHSDGRSGPIEFGQIQSLVGRQC